MSLTILQTKLYASSPQRQKNVVPRPHLLDKLTRGLAGKSTLISAPAGFGKSTLLSEWLHNREVLGFGGSVPSKTHNLNPQDLQFCWLTLDNDDNDPVRFLMYLIASLQKFGKTVGETAWPLLQSPQPPAIKTILTILLNDLGLLTSDDEHWHSCYVLVLEDYHLVTTASIHEAITYLIDHLPPQIHVIITTRADPPLPFSRWRARDQLSEIRAADLRFTSDEVATFLNDRMGLHLSTADVLALETRTEGWIAGLQLVALSLQGHTNKAGFLQTFSGGHRYILNYLVDEVLNQQTKVVQEFLLRTSILDRLSGALCDTLMRVEERESRSEQENPSLEPSLPLPLQNSQQVLEQLYNANLFTIPLDDEGQWYRYHPLFAEALQHRLHQTHPETWRRLHDQASRWYEQKGLLADAIQHALRSADFPHMAELIEQSWPATWNQGSVATLLNWVHQLPPHILFAHPSLAISHAWALAFAGQIEAAEVDLRRVEALLQQVGGEFEPSPLTRNTLLGRIAALRAMLAARQGAPAQAVQLAQSALDLIPTEAAQLRGNACYALGLAYQQRGSLTEALAAYQTATRLGLAADDHFLTVTARYHEGRIWMARGQLKMAVTTYQQILDEATQHERSLPVIGLAHVGYAEILYQRNDLTSAAHQIESGLALSPSGSLTYTDGPLHRFVTLAQIRQAGQDRVGTLAAVQEAMDTARQTGITLDVDRARALHALIHLRLGQLETARAWADSYSHSLQEEEHFTYVHEFEMLAFVRVLLAQRRATEALALLVDWLPVADADQRQGSMVEMWVLQALALQIAGQSAEAQQTLGRALVLAEPQGYIRLFVDEGEPMRVLLSDLRLMFDDANLRAYTGNLLATFENPPNTLPEAKIENLESKIYNLIEPLTSRELEVLQLMAAGLSNAAIAEQLVVSVGTIKTHLKHIYGKLAVESRTQAVAQARTLGLL